MSLTKENGDWKEFRTRFPLLPEDEIDFHSGPRDPSEHQFYGEQFEGIEERILEALKQAQEWQLPYIMLRHGWSTSSPGRTTARSIIRRFMRSKTATPYIERSGCIEHKSVFVVKVRQTMRA